MGEVWSGAIALNEPSSVLQDVHLSSSFTFPNALIQGDAKLSFLSIVDIVRIPLYLVIGQSLDVQVGHEGSLRWIWQRLSAGTEDEDTGGNAPTERGNFLKGEQSLNRGVLLKVHNAAEGDVSRPRVTELLLCASADSETPTLPIPQISSSPGPSDHRLPQSLSPAGGNLKLYALPLSSDMIRYAENVNGLCSPPPEENGKAYFLPEYDADLEANTKRRKMSSLFDDATKKRRKLKGRGGESVAQAMANVDRPASQHGLTLSSRSAEDTAGQGISRNMFHRKGLSRAYSMGSLQSAEHSRPASRSGPSKPRSSLHRMESAYLAHEDSVASDAENSILEQNKAAISKIVMTGLRLHGLQQKKKPSKVLENPSLSQSALVSGVDQEGEDGYKLVYHQTLKAAMFTFRAHASCGPLGQDAMRDVVDKLLDIFCTDPLLARKDMSFGSRDLQQDQDNPFDLPSSSAQVDNAKQGWNTPSIKKRRMGFLGDLEPG